VNGFVSPTIIFDTVAPSNMPVPRAMRDVSCKMERRFFVTLASDPRDCLARLGQISVILGGAEREISRS